MIDFQPGLKGVTTVTLGNSEIEASNWEYALSIIGFLAVIGALIGGGVYFYKKHK